MFEYKRPDWTYHAKGLWCSSQDFELPFITMIGSPNFGNFVKFKFICFYQFLPFVIKKKKIPGERSVKHDLECQFLAGTLNENLQYELSLERKNLYNYCHLFTEDTWLQSDRKIPYWVKAVVYMFRSYL